MTEGTTRNAQNDPAVGGIVINGRDITCQLNGEHQNAEEARLRNLLSESAIGLVQLSTKDSIYQFIGGCLSSALAKCAVLVNSHDVASSMLRVESIVVPGEDMVDIWPELRSMRFTWPEGTVTRTDLMSGVLVPLAGGLRSIFDAGFPAALHDRIEGQLPDSETYVIGLASDDHLLGTVAIVSATSPTVDVAHHIEVIARQASITLQRAGAEATLRDYNVRLVRSTRELAKRVADLEAIHQISIALASHRESRTILQTIVEQVRELLDVESCSILLPDEESGDMLFQAATHDIVGMHVPAGQGIASRVLEDGKPRVVQHVESDPDHYVGVSVESGIPVRSLLAIPLAIEGQTIGVLEAVNKRRGTFSDNDRDLIVTMANHAAVALENARLYEAHTKQLKHQVQAEETLAEFSNSLEQLVQQHASHLKVLYALSEQIGLTHNIEELVHLLLDNLHRAVPCDVAASMVAKDDRITITIRPTRPVLPPVVEGITRALLSTLAAETGREAEDMGPVDVRMPDSEATAQSDREPPIETLLSIAQAPITGDLDKGCLGVIAVADQTEDAFCADHIQLLRSLGNQVAMFLSIRHLEQTLREREKHYRSTVENQTELISQSLPDGKLAFVNDAYCLYFGKPAEELLGRYFIPSIPGDDLVRVLRLWDSLAPDKPLVSYTHMLVVPDGESRWVHWTTRAVFDENKNIVEYQSVGHDVTEEYQKAENGKLQVKYERLVSEILSIARHITPETTGADVTQALQRIGEFTGSDWGFLITLRDPCLPGNTPPATEGASQIQSTFEWLVEGAPSLVEHVEDHSLAKFPWWLGQLQHRDSVQVPTITGLPPEAAIEAELWRSLGMRSLVSVPLMTGDTLIGVIGLASTFADGEAIGKQAALLKVSGEFLTNAIHGMAKQSCLEAVAKEKDVLPEEIQHRVNSNL